jgi:replicative DNA helicase
MLYSDNSALMVLGHLLNRPSILLSDKYKLENIDFAPNEFNRTMFWAIRSVVAQGAKELNEISIDTFLQNDEARYNLAKKNDFMGFIREAKELAQVDDFDYHYNVLKKF